MPQHTVKERRLRRATRLGSAARGARGGVSNAPRLPEILDLPFRKDPRAERLARQERRIYRRLQDPASQGNPNYSGPNEGNNVSREEAALADKDFRLILSPVQRALEIQQSKRNIRFNQDKRAARRFRGIRSAVNIGGLARKRTLSIGGRQGR